MRSASSTLLSLSVALTFLSACAPLSPRQAEIPRTCFISPEAWAVIEAPQNSVARVWDELTLEAIRNVLPQPTAHARNLFHVSAAMYDTWASFDPKASGVFTKEKHQGTPEQTAEAINYAAYRVLRARFAPTVPGLGACFDDHMRRIGLNPGNTGTQGNAPAAIGNRIGQAVLSATLNDGSNEAGNYADTSGYRWVNEPLQPQFPGIRVSNPDHWQRLLLDQPFTQNGIPLSGPQPYMGAQWGAVRPFAMSRSGRFYHDPGPAPTVNDPQMTERWIPDLLRKQAQLDPNLPDLLDISPASLGNNSLGSNDGKGHTVNPVTGKPYAPSLVRRAYFGRAIAEYWADGPRSETPPGHWNVIANSVADTPGFQPRIGGQGRVLGRLEWDVKLYLALNGALHDAAISAWEIKRQTDTARPISLVRYLAGQGRLKPEPGVVEVRGGRLLVRGWQPSGNMTWEDPSIWMPFQAGNFVSPAFPAFVSGHSTFSRAAAEVLADLTGTPYFPGGLRQVALPHTLSPIDRQVQMPEIRLQWATYFDAADQSGQSRIWGGIHIEPDDFAGRRVGHEVGVSAVALARRYFDGLIR